MTSSSFDAWFEQPEETLFWNLITRIENRQWRMANIQSLRPQAAHLVRLAFLVTRYNNGGLLYVFECDQPGFGKAIADALAWVGLPDGADVLREAFELFPTAADYDDWDRRFATIARVRDAFDRLDERLGNCVGQVAWSAGRYARDHRSEFEWLRAHPPYDPGSDSYNDQGPDAG
jgi:hypothetical protein